MKTLFFVLFCALFQIPTDKNDLKKEIFRTEKAFEKMVSEKGMAEAFYFFADDSAVIKRENDTLISGKENIRRYYEQRKSKNSTLNWTPDFLMFPIAEHWDTVMENMYGDQKIRKGTFLSIKGCFIQYGRGSPTGAGNMCGIKKDYL